MTEIVEKLVSTRATDSNPFASMGLMKFWPVSTVFYLTFPISLWIWLVVPGPRRTRQLISALMDDVLQTILLLLVVLMLLSWGISGISWVHFLADDQPTLVCGLLLVRKFSFEGIL